MEAIESQQFFTNTATGLNRPIKPHKSLITPSNVDIKYIYKLFKGHFDDHIDTSIPWFLENKLQTISAIQKTYTKAKILDIGSSSGAYGMALAYLNTSYDVTVIDPNDAMLKNSHTLKYTNFKALKQCFHKSFDNSIPVFQPQQRYDIIRESMTFQFIDSTRLEAVIEVQSILNPDGIFLTEEKFNLDNEQFYNQNERLKVSYKSKYYLKQVQNKKQEEILVGMKENQYNYNNYINILQTRFNYVELYYRAGNFRGIIATNSLEKLTLFMKEMKTQPILQDNLYCTKETYALESKNDLQKDLEIYNYLTHKSKYTLDQAEYDNISLCLSACNKLAFAMIDTEGNFCHLYKHPACVFDTFVSESVEQRLSKLTNIKPTLNTFDFKNRKEDMEKLGFRVIKEVPFNPDSAGFEAKGITAVLYMKYDPNYEPSWWDNLLMKIKK